MPGGREGGWNWREKIASALKYLSLSTEKVSEEMVSEIVLTEDSRYDDLGKTTRGEKVRTMENALPEELVEKILAMVPFPYVFKARVLSKSWLTRFSPISSIRDDEVKKRFASSFQKRMGEWSAKWKTFCPVAYCEGNLMGYDRASRIWRRLPSLSFLPEHVLRGLEHFKEGTRQISHNLQIEGALVLLTIWPTYKPTEYCKYDLYVANILTQTWKQLPPRPHGEGLPSTMSGGVPGREIYWPGIYYQRRLLSQSSGIYKVITVYHYGEAATEEHDGYHLLQIYDSRSAAWSTKKLLLSIDFQSRVPAAYLDGFLYMGVCDLGFSRLSKTLRNSKVLRVPILNVEEETLEEFDIQGGRVPMPEGFSTIFGRRCGEGKSVTMFPMTCNGDLLMIASSDREPRPIQVFKVDLGSQKLLQLASVSNHCRDDFSFYSPVVDGHWIFFGVVYDCHRVVGYNVHNGEWTSFPFTRKACQATTDIDMQTTQRGENFRDGKARRKGKDVYHWIGSSFRPGLNPFAPL